MNKKLIKVVTLDDLREWIEYKSKTSESFSLDYTHGYTDALENLMADIAEGRVSAYFVEEPEAIVL